MITHVVLFKLKDNSAENVETAVFTFSDSSADYRHFVIHTRFVSGDKIVVK